MRLPELEDVGGVVPSVPLVKRKNFGKAGSTAFRMHVATIPGGDVEGLKQIRHACVQGDEQGQGRVHRPGDLGGLRPISFRHRAGWWASRR